MEKELGHPLRDGLSSQAMEPQASPPKASIPDAEHLAIIHGDGVTDDTRGLKALLAGKIVYSVPRKAFVKYDKLKLITL